MEIGCKMMKIFYLTVFIIIITNFIKIQYERTYETEKHTNVQNLQSFRKFSKSVQSKKLKVSNTQENSIAFLEILLRNDLSRKPKMSFNSKSSTSGNQQTNVNRANLGGNGGNATANSSFGFQNPNRTIPMSGMQQNNGNQSMANNGNQYQPGTGNAGTVQSNPRGNSGASSNPESMGYGRNVKAGSSVPTTSQFLSDHGIDRNSRAGQFVQQAQRGEQKGNDPNEEAQLMSYKQAETYVLEHLNARELASATVRFIFSDITKEARSALPEWVHQHNIEEEIDKRALLHQSNVSKMSQNTAAREYRPGHQEQEQPSDNLDTNTVIQNYHALLIEEVQAGGIDEGMQNAVIECIMEGTEIASMRLGILPRDIDTTTAEVASMLLAGTLESPRTPKYWNSYKPTQLDKEEFYPTVYQLVIMIDRVGINPARMASAIIDKHSDCNGELAQMISDPQALKDVINAECDIELESRRSSKPFPTPPGTKKDLAQVKTGDRVTRYIFPNQPQPTINESVRRDMSLEEGPTQVGALVVGGFLRITPIEAIVEDIQSIMHDAGLKYDIKRLREGLNFPDEHPHNPTKVHEHPITGVFSVVVWLIPSCKCKDECQCRSSTNPLDEKLHMPDGTPIPQRPTAYSSMFFSNKGAMRPSESKGGNAYSRPYMISAITSVEQLPEHSDNVLLVVGGMGRHSVINYAIVSDVVGEIYRRSEGALTAEDIKVTFEVHSATFKVANKQRSVYCNSAVFRVRVTTPSSIIEKIHKSFEVVEGAQAVRVIWAGIQLTLSATTHLNETTPPVSSEQPALLLVNNNYGDLQSTSFALRELLDINHCHTILRYTPTTMMVISRAGYSCSAQTFAEAGHTHGDERPRLNPVQFNPKNQDLYLVHAPKAPSGTQPNPSAQRAPALGDARLLKPEVQSRSFMEPSPHTTPRESVTVKSGNDSTISTKGTIQSDQIQQMVTQMISNTFAQSALESRLLEEDRRLRDDKAAQTLIALMETINRATALAEAERQRNSASQELFQQALRDITQRQDQLQLAVAALPLIPDSMQFQHPNPIPQQAVHMSYSILAACPPAPVSTKRQAVNVPVSDAARISSAPTTPGRQAKKADTATSPASGSAQANKPQGAIPQPLNQSVGATVSTRGTAPALSTHSSPGPTGQPGAPNAQHQTSQGANLVTANTIGSTAAAAPPVESVRPTARASQK